MHLFARRVWQTQYDMSPSVYASLRSGYDGLAALLVVVAAIDGSQYHRVATLYAILYQHKRMAGQLAQVVQQLRGHTVGACAHHQANYIGVIDLVDRVGDEEVPEVDF